MFPPCHATRRTIARTPSGTADPSRESHCLFLTVCWVDTPRYRSAWSCGQLIKTERADSGALSAYAIVQIVQGVLAYPASRTCRKLTHFASRYRVPYIRIWLY